MFKQPKKDPHATAQDKAKKKAKKNRARIKAINGGEEVKRRNGRSLGLGFCFNTIGEDNNHRRKRRPSFLDGF